MPLVSYNPWKEMQSLQSQIDSIFNDMVTPASLGKGNFARIPAAELTETPDALHLKVELPGIQTDDLNIEVTAKTVTVSGDRQLAKSEAEGKTRSEFQYGKFHRVIALPVEVQNTEVKAEYKDGILHLTLPKVENKVVKVALGKAAV